MMIILMFIGASPGGTGGGIKTSTFVIVLLFLGSMIYERDEANIAGRRISDDTVKKALTIFILSLFMVVISTILILLFDTRFLMLDVLFEVTSAFGTVGLSRGITPHLGALSQLVVVTTMIIGRIGPLTFLMAILQRAAERTAIRYPEAKVMIG
jgi:trk system potassium uptake protein TrkH